ncbi:hypothetical protein HUA78_15750 [Myxococcus sp. CA033]|uniref:hypothetical protein n=1 Tax=Myxococcus sp. CA033 TaxID=2741516 RepID=UPI00157ADBE2|nr:hypothetical protein [Myxococcus sp. CA033]NTX35902.1 hypothetical protein [Myxococcus sp. CA033]
MDSTPPTSDWPTWAKAFPPQEGEHVLATGGPWFMAYFLAFMVSLTLLPTVVFPLLGIWFFWGRSGKFLLTSHRLIWKPNLGKAVIVPRDALRSLDVDVGPRLRSVQLRGERKVSMPLLWKYKQLWGGLALLQQWKPPAPTSSTPALKVASAWLVSGMELQPGAVVIESNGVRFFPAEPRANVASEAGAALVGLALGVTRRTHRAQVPVEAALSLVARAEAVEPELDALGLILRSELWQGPPVAQGNAGAGRTRMTYQQGKRKLTFVVPTALLPG